MSNKLQNVYFLDKEFDEFDLEICTSNYTEHRVVMSLTTHDEEERCIETLLSDEQIDSLIQALESAKDLRQARIEQNESIAPKTGGTI